MRGGRPWPDGAAPVFSKRSWERMARTMIGFLVWCILFVLCWPLALVIAVLIPLVWLIVLPFRVAFAVVEWMLSLVFGILSFPFRLMTRC